MSTELTYHDEGGYLLPDLTAPEVVPLGIWGMRRWEFLKRHRNGLYAGVILPARYDFYAEDGMLFGELGVPEAPIELLEGSRPLTLYFGVIDWVSVSSPCSSKRRGWRACRAKYARSGGLFG